MFQPTSDQARWAKGAKRKYKRPLAYWFKLMKEQDSCCRLSSIKLLFDSKSGTPIAGGEGCHPLYASADHINPGNPVSDFQLVCYDLNDLKGHLPQLLFNALCCTDEWKHFINCWKSIANQPLSDRSAFKQLILNGNL